MKSINIGLVGFGTVGSGVVEVLQAQKKMLKNLTGRDINLKYICDKDITSNRGVKVNKRVLTKDLKKVLNNPEIDIVVELIGGIHPANEIILMALKNKKHVVTANKALLAENSSEIFRTAKMSKREVRFEGSVGAGIPIIKALREGFAANKITAIYGIINGTSNYILSRMSDEGCTFGFALKAAKKMGVAEANPRLDINGADSAHKLILLTELSFGVSAKMRQVYCEGILAIEPRDIKYAREMGYAIKLLGVAKRSGNKVEVRVHPTLVPVSHLLANVKGVYNAIYVKGDLIGETLLYGEGAGKYPTASAVVSDIIDLAKSIGGGNAPQTAMLKTTHSPVLTVRKMEETKCRYYIRFSAVDKPGVLASISGILAKSDISISHVTQKEQHREKVVPIVMMTHLAQERNLRKALKLIDKLPAIKKKTVAVRMESL